MDTDLTYTGRSGRAYVTFDPPHCFAPFLTIFEVSPNLAFSPNVKQFNNCMNWATKRQNKNKWTVNKYIHVLKYDWD